MAMTAGSVSVADDGTVTKSGLAGELYDARVALLPAQSGGLQFVVAQRRSLAASCQADAGVFVSYWTTNANAVITTSDSGLQQVASMDTQAPATTKYLSIV